MTIQLEICLEHVDCAVAAQAGGAQRIELCSNLLAGGITPSIGLIEQVRELVNLDIMVMIRPRGGDFLYSEFEYQVMQRDITRLQGLGVEGVVFGLLNRNAAVDRDRTARLLDLARPLAVTFHRAFDMSRDPFEALDVLLELGVDRILTSGQAASALEGIHQIQSLQAAAGDQAIILPAAGVDHSSGPQLVREAGVRELHIGSGVKERIGSSMGVQKLGISMGSVDDESEFEQNRVLASKVASMMTAVNQFE